PPLQASHARAQALRPDLLDLAPDGDVRRLRPPRRRRRPPERCPARRLPRRPRPRRRPPCPLAGLRNVPGRHLAALRREGRRLRRPARRHHPPVRRLLLARLPPRRDRQAPHARRGTAAGGGGDRPRRRAHILQSTPNSPSNPRLPCHPTPFPKAIPAT